MSDINIPGVSDKYKTNDLVKSLLEVEKIPLKREQSRLDEYKAEKDCWQRVNQYMNNLRETTRSLYSFNNPFSEKISNSSDEYAVTATPGRDAALESFKIDVEKIATADRFLSDEIDKDMKAPQGKYVFEVGEKSVTMNWKGGKISEFVAALNKRSNGIVKAAVVGVSNTKQTLLIESLKTGADNKLIFKESAEQFAKEIGMIRSMRSENSELSQKFSLSPENSNEVKIPSTIVGNTSMKIEFTLKPTETTDVTTLEGNQFNEPVLPENSYVNFKGITIYNDNSDTTLPYVPPKEPRQPIEDYSVVFLKMADGTEKKLEDIPANNIEKKYQFSIDEYKDAESIVFRNSNTGKEIAVSKISAYNKNAKMGYEPTNPITVAGDAKIKYEGISISRPENKIDDVVPNVTLNIESPTDKTVTISIKPDIESAKDAIIDFVGKYNQLVAELNILTQTKPEIVAEIAYFSDEDKKSAMERLGKFQSEFALTNEKTSLQRIVNSTYNANDTTTITMLSQLGISSKAGSSSTISAAQLRGYLEIDEKKLDEMLKDHIPEIKLLFGFDTDEDLIIDNGIAHNLDKNLQSYVQIGGVLAMKNRAIDTKISTSEQQIKKLETQVAAKEVELKRKYGQMEATLNNLESQQSTISNFNKQYDNRK